MTTEQYIRQLNSKIDKLKTGLPVGIAAQDTHVKMVERIFEKGENAAEGEIGSYNSTNPIYINPNDSPKKFPTKGKNGQTKFKNGENHKTGYFESYKAYREKIGRQSDKVNLNLFGNLLSDFGKGVIKLNPTSFASTLSRKENRFKAEGINKKYGDVFKLTEEERDNFKEVLNFEIMQILK